MNDASLDIHAFVAPLDRIDWPRVSDQYLRVLSPYERDRCRRFRHVRNRREYLAAHVLLRTKLASALGLPAELLEFDFGAQGKPSLRTDSLPIQWQPSERVEFNLSHTTGMVACVIVRGAAVGVDVEALDRRVRLELAHRYFADAEIACLERAAPDEQSQLFLTFWTLKEAYLKARGCGISMPLGQFAFDLARQPPQIEFAPQLRDNPDCWHFFSSLPGANHQLAVAVQFDLPHMPRPRLHVHETLPDEPFDGILT